MPRIVVTYGRDQWLPAYLEALTAAGLDAAEAIALCPDQRAGRDAGRILSGADGLLLTGGDDVDPRHYGEEPLPGAGVETSLPERDRLELDLVTAARDRRLPTLAICRGLQVLNVALGGTLWQDLPLQLGVSGHDFPTADWPRDKLAHEVLVNGDRLPIQRWLGRQPVQVNSRHHQAVREPAGGLVVAAQAPDGVIEAMAADDPGWWAWGVQWHPENLVGSEPHRGLFRELLTAAENRR